MCRASNIRSLQGGHRLVGDDRKMTIRVGLIGAGVMGSDHARIISEDISGATLHAVCDASETAAEGLADRCGASVIETDGIALLSRKDVDAVVVASPDSTHAELSLAAIDLRKPVLCEKPLAQTSAECLKVLKAETALGKQLVQVGFMRRFDPAYAEMQTALRSGCLGSTVMMHNFHRNVETPAADFTSSMAITNSAPHEFDAIRFVLGAEISGISAFEPGLDLETGKPVVMVIETDAGQLVTVEVNNNASYGYDVRCELVGTLGSFSLGGSASGKLDANLHCSVDYASDWRLRFAEAYRLQDKAWIRSIEKGESASHASNAWDGYCAAVVAEAGVSALASGQKTVVDLASRPALYDRLGASE